MSVKIYRSGQPHTSEDRAVFLYFKRVKFTLIFSPNPMFMGKVHFIKTFGSEVFLHIKCQFCMHLFTIFIMFSLQTIYSNHFLRVFTYYLYILFMKYLFKSFTLFFLQFFFLIQFAITSPSLHMCLHIYSPSLWCIISFS